MSTTRMFEAVNIEGAGLWVGANQYGEELPTEKDAKFIVRKAVKGLWQVALKGYNDGDFFDIEINSSGDAATQIDGKYYEAIDRNQRLVEVDDNTMQRYEAALWGVENKGRGLLLDVLENNRQGIWSISGAAEYNEYEEFARLIYEDPDRVGLAWGEWQGVGVNNSNQSGYHLKKPVAAMVFVDGPEYHVRPCDQRIRGVRVSAIADRIKYFPIAANMVRNFTESDECDLRYMNDDFEFGCPLSAVNKPSNPLETIYGK